MNPLLVIAVFDKALAEKRVNVILATVVRWVSSPNPPCGRRHRASRRWCGRLDYPEARVQLAAAEAMLRNPIAPSPTGAVRALEVLRRAIAAEPDKGAGQGAGRLR